jgi:hypothetical protein
MFVSATMPVALEFVLFGMLKMNAIQPTLIKAAFVVLYDVALADNSSTIPRELEDRSDTLRRLIRLSRKEAQHILAHPMEMPSAFIPAALVLAYEGTGTHRVEPDFTFQQADILLLTTARRCARMSTKRALRCCKRITSNPCLCRRRKVCLMRLARAARHRTRRATIGVDERLHYRCRPTSAWS